MADGYNKYSMCLHHSLLKLLLLALTGRETPSGWAGPGTLPVVG